MIKEDGIKIVNEHYDNIREMEKIMTAKRVEEEYWKKKKEAELKRFEKECMLSLIGAISIVLIVYFVGIAMSV